MGRNKVAVSRFNAQNTRPDDVENETLASLPRDNKPILAKDTIASRDRVFSDWNAFMCHKYPQVDREEIWERVVTGDHAAKQLVLDFIDNYIKLSGRPTRAFDATDQPKHRPVTCVTTANSVLKRLIAAADAEIMRPLRARDTSKAWMFLSRAQGPAGAQDLGPIRDITRWIATTLKDKWGLTIDSEYEKVGATAEDLQRLLQTLWERADHVPMSPQNRVIFHMFLLLMYLPGCRPGMLPKIRWRDVTLQVTRDEGYPGGRKLELNVLLFRNKRRRDAVLTGSDEDRFDFDTTMMPTPLACVTHLLIARAWQQNAFEIQFDSIEDVLHRPIISDSGSTYIRWKKDMLDKRFIPMSYSTFYTHWHRLCIVAGCETVPRPYTFRVGAAATIDKNTTETSRNFIVGHSTRTFQKKYQSRNIQYDLQAMHFGPLSGNTGSLFKRPNGMVRHYDAYAPIYATQAHVEEYQAGKGVVDLLDDINVLKARGADDSEIKAAESSLTYWRTRFNELALLARRKQYFEQTARLRQENDEAGLRDLQEDPYLHYRGPGLHLKLDIQGLMQSWAPGTTFDAYAEARSIRAMRWLVYYMDGSFELISRRPYTPHPSPLASVGPARVKSQDNKDDGTATSEAKDTKGRLGSRETNVFREVASAQENVPEVKPAHAAETGCPMKPSQSICFICRASFRRRAELTRHSRAHISTLSAPFSCPECKREGLQPPTTRTPSQWSNHVERVHGKQHAPSFPTNLDIPKTSTSGETRDISCAICNDTISVLSFNTHVNKKHVHGLLADEIERVTCPECPSAGRLSIDAYVSHVSARHGIQTPERCPFCRKFFMQRGLVTHVRTHFKRLLSPIPCPLCEQQGRAGAGFEDYTAWRIHAIRALDHLREGSAMALVCSPDGQWGTKRKADAELAYSGHTASLITTFRVGLKRQRQDGRDVTPT